MLDVGPHHAGGALGPKCQRAVAAVGEGVHLLAHHVGARAGRAGVDLGVLEGRGDDLVVAGRLEHRPGGVDDGAPAASIGPVPVAGSARSLELAAHGRSSARNGLVASSASRVVTGPWPGQHHRLGRQQLVHPGDALEQPILAAAGKVGAPDRTAEKHVAREHKPVGEVCDRVGRVTGHSDRAEVHAAHRDDVPTVDQVFGLVFAAGKRTQHVCLAARASRPPRRSPAQARGPHRCDRNGCG